MSAPSVSAPSVSAPSVSAPSVLKGRVSNTGPSMYNSANLIPLSFGADGLSGFTRVSIPPSFQLTLDNLRWSETRAAHTEQRKILPVATSFCFGPPADLQPLMLHPFNNSEIPYLLSNDYGKVTLYSGVLAAEGATCNIRASARFCFVCPIEVVLASVQTFALEHFGSSADVYPSSVDLAFDFASPGTFTGADAQDFEDCIVSRVQTVTPHLKRTSTGTRVESLYLGKRGAAISAIIYDKSREIKRSHKEYMLERWFSRGWNGVDGVWRLEMRFKREFLATVVDLAGNPLTLLIELADYFRCLWQYATGVWLRHTLPSLTDSNRRRWANSDFWQFIAGDHAILEDMEAVPFPALIRVHVRNMRADALVSQILGCALSWQALNPVEALSFADLSRQLIRQGKLWERRRNKIWADSLSQRKRLLGVAA